MSTESNMQFYGDVSSDYSGSNNNISLSDIKSILNQLTPEQMDELLALLPLDKESDIPAWLTHHSTDTDNAQLMQYTTYKVHKALLLYVPPFIIILGTLGNVFSFLILRRRAMLKFSTYFYLMVLALADTSVLYVGLLPKWLGELTGLELENQANWLCKAYNAIGYTVSDFSVWLIIAVTIERYIVVCHPLKANRLCNTRTARNIIITILCLLCLFNIHFLFTVGLHESTVPGSVETKVQCRSTIDHEFFVDAVVPWLDAFIYSFAPFVVIMSLNGLIIHQVMMAKKLRVEMRGGDYEQRRPSHEGSTRLTLMLLIISFAFLLLTLPMSIVNITAHFLNSHNIDLEREAEFLLAKTATTLLMYMNHSINFYLYCATGQKFRHQLVWMVCHAKKTYNLTWGSDESRRGGSTKTGFPSSISKSLMSTRQRPETMDLLVKNKLHHALPINLRGSHKSKCSLTNTLV